MILGAGALAGEGQRESVDDMWAQFTVALAIASGGLDVDIVREGASEVGLLSLHEMLGVLATVGDARAKAGSQPAIGRFPLSASASTDEAPTRRLGTTARLIGTAGAPSHGMARTLGAAAEDTAALVPFVAHDPESRWVWVLVRRGEQEVDGVWVRYLAEAAPEGLEMRAAQPPRPGSIGVVVLRAPQAGPSEIEGFGPTVPRRRARDLPAVDRNLVTTEEFAASVDCSEASVFELLKLGLPSIKSRGIGRRILKREATEWLINGGASRSRVAMKLAKTTRKRMATGGDGG
jgi:hypothetical protein